MKFIETKLEGVIIIEPDVFKDGRGYFMETWQDHKYRAGGIPGPFVQDNQSRSVKGTLRGMHAQMKKAQGKLVRAVEGEIYDVVADIRAGSPSYRQWIAVTLTADNCRQIYVPPGYSHGICIVSDFASVAYKVTDFYDPSDELRILWNDPELAIEWPFKEPLLSDKDRGGKNLKDIQGLLPVYKKSA